jgi:pimeloyl-ACP methyl ester carboxylesterase
MNMKLCRLVALLGLACIAPQMLHAQTGYATAPAPIVLPPATRLPHISVESLGSGDPVVLIPGLASPRDVWAGILRELAGGHRVLLVQINGFGGDDPGANAQGEILPGVVADLVRYFDENGIVRPAVIGHSMGGLIGMMLVKAHPDHVGRLMIVDSLPFFGVLMGPNATVESVRPVAAQLRTMMSSQTGNQPAPPNMSLTDRGRAQIALWMNAANHQVTGQAAYEDLTSDLRADVPAIGRVPVTVLYAVSDPAHAAQFRAIFAGAYAAAPSIRVIPVENSAHFIMLDQPDRFREAVMAFLAAPQ